jgi:hypothetical protein
LYNLILELVIERDQHPDLVATVIDRLLEPRLEAIMGAMRRAAGRGEIRPGAASELLARVGPALVIQQRLHLGTLPDRDEIDDIVDNVLLPALGARREPNSSD